MSKIPVYFMPGLAASPAIFERIKLDESVFEMCESRSPQGERA